MEGIKMVPCCSGSTCPSPVPVVSPTINRHAIDMSIWNPRSRGVHRRIGTVAAARHNGGLIPGVVMPGTTSCLIPWGGQAVAKMDYFVLCNPGGVELVWQRANNGEVPRGALQGGYSETGEKLYFGRLNHGGILLSGKVHPSHRVCYVPYNGQEVQNSSYEVLCLKTVPLANLGF
ncbi:hypothetical protein Pmani_012020 [Petrolisthes manimaculis]|uniref:Uncharacterized protein n=1 Tax=Petrolisthes manimaculis TaxID=1843537 RepID=A0AAE1UAN4_9EUCA|nr:hypothetical protein Pmani_012020 [Petrolisthes manimaculis]